jgi:hypothetical protein
MKKGRSNSRVLARRWIAFLVTGVTLAATQVFAQTNTEAGLAYLHSTQSPAGNWETTATSLHGQLPTTTTSLDALKRLEDLASPNQDAAILYLISQTIEVNDHLARFVAALAGTGEDTMAALTTLLAQQNTDGGWGGAQGHTSNHLDTALVLLALRTAGTMDPAVLGAALGYLLQGQQADGGWGFVPGEASRVYYSAVVLQALDAYRVQFDTGAAMQAAVQYLRSQPHADGGFGAGTSTTFETALALLSLLEAGVDFTAVEGNALALIETRQQPNGSWEDDPYATALALLVIERNRRATLPDLTIAAFTPSDPTPARGAIVTLSIQICNQGQTTAPAAVVRLFLGDPHSGGQAIGADQVLADLPPGGCTTVAQGFDTTGREGSQVLFVSVDPDHAITEANEDDNVGTTVLQLQVIFANVPPTITSTAITTALTDVPYTYDVEASDLDGDALTYTLRAGPVGMTIDPASGRLHWLPRRFDVGDVAVDVQVSDSRGGTAQQQFIVTVTLNNRPPIITSTPVTDAAIGEAYAYPVAATDPDGDAISFFLLQGPPGMHIEQATGVVRWTPAAGQEGVHNVMVQAVDARGAETRQTYSVRILAAAFGADLVVAQVNNRPVITDTQILSIGGTVEVTVGNAGSVAVSQAFALLLFYDENGNHRFDNGVDTVLGQTTIAGLAARETTTLGVSVAGILRFRDDLIYAFVDSGNQVAEVDEGNNLRNSGDASEFHPRPGPFTPQLKWAWTGSAVMPAYDDVMMTPLVVNLTDDNGDGRINADDIPDVVFVTFDHTVSTKVGILRAISGKDGSAIWDVTDADLRVMGECPIAAGDLDSDGQVEIVAGSGTGFGSPYPNRLLIFEHDGSFKGAGDEHYASVSCGTPSIVDMDNDGSPEIVIGKTVFNADGTLRFEGSQIWLPAVWKGDYVSAPSATTADLDGDGKPELLTGAVVYREDGSVYFDVGATLNLDRRLRAGGYPAFGNFNDDPYPEVVVAYGYVSVFDHTGQLIWQSEGGLVAGAPPTVADFDGDGRLEIGVATSRDYNVVDHDGSLLWSFPIAETSSGFTGSTVFDFEGDGAAEVVYADEEYLRVFRGSDGAVLFQTPNPSLTVIESPVVADVDNDGRAEIIVGRNQGQEIGIRTGTYDSGIFVYGDDQLDNWVGTRRIWNQQAYYITNVNEDGTIPQVETPNWQVFNNFRQNEQLPREGEKGPYAAPDLTASFIRVDETACPASAVLTARIGNGGGDMAPAGVPVSFYDGDPDTGAAVIGSAATTQPLLPGDFEDLSVTFANPTPERHLITAAADDGGGITVVETGNLADLDGVWISDYDNFYFPESAIDNISSTSASSPAGLGAGKPAFLEISFPFPVNISSLRMYVSYASYLCDLPLQAFMNLSNGFAVQLDTTPRIQNGVCTRSYQVIVSPAFPLQQDVDWLRIEFPAGFDGSRDLSHITEIEVGGSYADPEGRRGIVAEGREDNNRALLTTSLCAPDSPGNLPPEILSSPVTSAIQEILYRYDVIATDRDSDPLDYALVTAPEGMMIDSVTGEIRWLPGRIQTGDFAVTVEVSDGNGGVAAQGYTVTVNPANLPPVITSSPPLAGEINRLYGYDVQATDPEGTALRFSLPAGPDGMAIDPDNGRVRWRPLSSQAGSHPVTVRVRDAGGAETEQSFDVVVSSPAGGPDLPDLMISQVDNRPSLTDTQTLGLDGEVAVTFGNAGNTLIAGAFEVLLFADRNGNGTYDGGSDITLGSAVYANGLDAGQFVTQAIEIDGTALFRDDLIYAFVDSGQVVAEADETNNILDTGAFSQIRPAPGVFAPAVERVFPLNFNRTPRHSPLVANLDDDNGDGVVDASDIPDILYINSWGRLVALSGKTGEELWSIVRTEVNYSDYGIPAVGDIDEDGLPEIVLIFSDRRSVAVLAHDGTLKFISETWPDALSYRSGAVHIANMDRQGPPEILAGNVILNGDGTLRCQGTGARGGMAGAFLSGRASDISTAVDLDLQGDLELVAGNTAYRSDCSILWQNTDLPDGWVSVGNLDNDPFPEIVLVGDDHQIRVLEHDGTVKAGPVSPPGGGDVAGPAVIADFDGDGVPEIGVGALQYTVFEPDLSVRWTTPPLSFGASTAFDFEGDGRAEVLVADVSGSPFEVGSQSFEILQGLDGNLLYRREIRGGVLALVYPVVVDMDNDGNAEVLVAMEEGIQVLGSPRDNWAGTRPIWNQFNYHITNVNEDGSIPPFEPDNGALYNNFLQNPSFRSAPDLTASRIIVNQDACPAAVQLTARIGNGGGLDIPAGVPVAFLEGDPDQGGEVIGSALTTQALAPGEYEDVSVVFASPAPGLHGISVAADLQTNFDNLALLAGTAAEASSSTNGLPAERLIDGNASTGICSPLSPVILEVIFPMPVRVSGITLEPYPVAPTTVYTGGTLSLSNGFELPVTLENGGGTFSFPLQSSITRVRFTADDTGCLSEFIVSGALETIPDVPGDVSRLESALIVHWPLDGSAEDTSGNGYHGTIGGSPEEVPGMAGTALALAGRNDYIISEALTDFSTDEITIAFWMKTPDQETGGALFSYASSYDDDDILITNVEGLRICRIGQCLDTGVSANDGAWHHIAVTWGGPMGSETKLYRDGALALFDYLGGPPVTGGGTVVLGQDQDVIGGGFQSSEAYAGTLDEVKVFNRALTAAEISLVYAGGPPPAWQDGNRVAEGREDNNVAFLALELCTGANAPPVITSEPLTAAMTDLSYTYPVAASDPDGDPLTFRLLLSPSGMTLQEDTGLIQWIPAFEQIGEHTISLQVSDGRGGMDVQSFTLTVAPRGEDVPPGMVDADGDGFPIPYDCDDSRAEINPAAPEIPGNGQDDDCNPATADAVGAGELACTVATDTVAYTDHEQVRMTASIQNLTPTTTFVAPRYGIAVSNVAGLVVFSEEQKINDLPAGATTATSAAMPTATLSPGQYDVLVEVLYAGTVAANCSATFTIRSSVETGTAFVGTIQSNPAQFNEGESTTITATVTNTGNVDVASVAIGIDVIRAETGVVVAHYTAPTSLARGETYSGSWQFVSSSTSAGKYLAILTATASPTQVLAGANFNILAVNQPPGAEAGPDQEVDVGTVVTLNGSASSDPDGDPLRYGWQFLSLPSASLLTDSEITDRNTSSPSFTPDEAGDYTLQLEVNDGELRDQDTVTVHAVMPNQPPVAEAGPDQYVTIGAVVTLDGSDSFDPDGDLITYNWSLEWNLSAIPAASALTDADLADRSTPQPSFVPDAEGAYVVQLMVDDGEASSEADYVEITAGLPNVPPNARAGDDQTVYVGDEVRLDGRASDDPDAGPQPLTYQWRFAAVPAASTLQDTDLVDAEQAQASFVPDVAGVYVLRLTVFDGEARDTADVTITASVPNVPPTAHAGDDQTVYVGDEVRLDGRASDDPDAGPQPLTYLWRFVSVAAGSTLTTEALRDRQTATPRFTPDVAGSSVVELEVFDGAARDTDHVVVTARGGQEAIGDLVARAKSGKIDLRWTPVTAAVSYNIYRRAEGEASYTLIAAEYVTDFAAYADLGLTNGVTYTYVVCWIDAAGNASPASNEASATPMARRRR